MQIIASQLTRRGILELSRAYESIMRGLREVKKMTAQRLLAVKKAYKEGKEIEFYHAYLGWLAATNPTWDRDIEYRVKSDDGNIHLSSQADDKETVELDLTDEQFMQLALEAHKQDITFNQHVENILRKFIEKEKEPRMIYARDMEDSDTFDFVISQIEKGFTYKILDNSGIPYAVMMPCDDYKKLCVPSKPL